MECSNCKKTFYFWNKFNRKYGVGLVWDKEGRFHEEVRFCSM